MAWSPILNVVDESLPIDNLVAYLSANAEDAIVWANGDLENLETFKRVYKSATGRLADIFPQLMVTTSSSAEELRGALEAAVAFTLEGTVTGPDLDVLNSNIRVYATAVKSMLLNVPISTLFAGGSNHFAGWTDSLETDFDVGFGNKAASSFLQIFQIRVTYRVNGSPE